MVDVSKALQRLDTFIFMKGETSKIDLEQWLDFLNANIYDELKLVLTKGDIQAALVLWIRHQSELELNPDMVKMVLETAGNNLAISVDSLNFLCRIITDCMLKLARNQATSSMTVTIETISSWILNCTKALESKKKVDWPKSGLDFAKALFDALHNVDEEDNNGLISGRIPLLLQEQKNHPESSLRKLMMLMNTLDDLVKLHTKFKIKVKIHFTFLFAFPTEKDERIFFAISRSS